MAKPKFPEITVELTGKDGNVFNLMGLVVKALRRAGVSTEDIGKFTTAVMTCGSYDEALVVIMSTVDVS
jgi:hypothetical protein